MDWPVLPRRISSALAGLCCLARSQGRVTAREIAACAGVPRAEAGKILQLLVWAGLVESRRGNKGGFWLRKAPQEILVADVLNFFSRPDEDTRRTPILSTLHELSQPCKTALAQLSIAELAQLEHLDSCHSLVVPGPSSSSRAGGYS